MAESPTFDYIVVGAGTTGCVVAARLSAHGRVLLLEQGGDDKDAGVPEIVQNPERVFDAVLGDTVSKTYMTVPQAGLGNKGAKNRRMRIQQGHVVGGGSSINGMIYVRGNYRDFDLWAQLSPPGGAHGRRRLRRVHGLPVDVPASPGRVGLRVPPGLPVRRARARHGDRRRGRAAHG